MMEYVTRLFKEEEGQALTEYGLLVGLIAVAVLAALAILTPSLETLFNDIVSKLTIEK